MAQHSLAGLAQTWRCHSSSSSSSSSKREQRAWVAATAAAAPQTEPTGKSQARSRCGTQHVHHLNSPHVSAHLQVLQAGPLLLDAQQVLLAELGAGLGRRRLHSWPPDARLSSSSNSSGNSSDSGSVRRSHTATHVCTAKAPTPQVAAVESLTAAARQGVRQCSPLCRLRRVAGRHAAARDAPVAALDSWCCTGCAPGSWRRPGAAQVGRQAGGGEQAAAAAADRLAPCSPLC